MDLFEKISSNKGPLGQYSDVAHGYFAYPKLEGEIGPRMTFQGKEMLVWSLNNYLGLANHPSVRKADAEASAKYGLGYPMGARMMSGESTMIEEFEKELSDFVGKEDTMVLNYGYQGILSIIDALVDRHDVIIYDAECHASIVDGVRLHQGKRFVFGHNDIDSFVIQLERASKLIKQSNGSILVITEGVFGMAGDMGKLREIVALKKDYNFRILIDDAHGFGTMGQTGAGTGEEQGIQNEIDIYFSTFAKSMAGIGAFVSSKKEVITFLRYNVRSQIFAKTLPMPMVIGLRKRLELLRTSPELKYKLWQITNILQKGLKDNGFDIGKTQSPVTPFIMEGSVGEAAQMIVDIRKNYNIFCSVVLYPVVPKNIMMLRIIPTSEHRISDVDYTINSFKEISDKLKKGYYSPDLSSLKRQEIMK
jgi:glycine C-acetyltransferase